MELIFEKSRKGRRCAQPFKCEVEYHYDLPSEYERKQPPKLPEIAEVDLVRHYMELSRRAYGVDNGFYPLGSCTMKYNPRVNDDVAGMFTNIHPLQPINTVQGCLEISYLLQQSLCEICGMDAFTLQPAAGAQGEWTGLQLIKAYHMARGDEQRINVIVPDSAHGTNPASAAMLGYHIINIPSTKEGTVDVSALRSAVNHQTAALMLTNPNTLGIFEKDIKEIAQVVHEAGGLVYYDGANLNAVMGISRPGDMGYDVVHLNLHKTFSTPHGGGGPGSGPVGCKAHLKEFLPVPVITFDGESYDFDYDLPNSIGKVKNFYGNFLVYVRAYAYILSLGAQGLKEASENAVLNANYLRVALQDYSDLKYTQPCMHEFVLSLETLKKETGVSALDIAKGLLDKGIHPPTMYFPMIVHEALMLEPTETESVETLENAAEVFKELFEKAKTDAQSLHEAPTTTPVRRLDEVQAARHPILRF
ncbi:MAG: aminomethyl-transferring glycine dehydrogenase subunit GcvPB [Christensenellaceae bacterium]